MRIILSYSQHRPAQCLARGRYSYSTLSSRKQKLPNPFILTFNKYLFGGQCLWPCYSLELECSLLHCAYLKRTNSNANSSRFSQLIYAFLLICSSFYFYFYLLSVIFIAYLPVNFQGSNSV